MTLPLEQAVREVCAEQNLEFPKIIDYRRTVFHITNEFVACYTTSAKRFPPEEPCTESLELVRPVTGRREYMVLLVEISLQM